MIMYVLPCEVFHRLLWLTAYFACWGQVKCLLHPYKQNLTEIHSHYPDVILIIVFRKISPNNLRYCQGNIELHGTSHVVWIAKCQCIHVKLWDWELNVNWGKRGQSPAKLNSLPGSVRGFQGEYIGSPLSLPASVWRRCRGGLAAFPWVCAGVSWEPLTCGSNRRMQKAIRNTFHTHSFKFQPVPGRRQLSLQSHSPPD